MNNKNKIDEKFVLAWTRWTFMGGTYNIRHTHTIFFSLLSFVFIRWPKKLIEGGGGGGDGGGSDDVDGESKNI